MSLHFPTHAHGQPRISLEADSVYAFGHLIRQTEIKLLELYTQGNIHGTLHTCLGQEICQIAVARKLSSPYDFLLSNHRNHGHFLTFTGAFLSLIAEIAGREHGLCGGVGGSQHLAYGRFHSNGIQGGLAGFAVGKALAIQRSGLRGSVGAIILGDGSLGEGIVYESMNLASLWSAPLIYVIENNQIAQTTSVSDAVSGNIEDRGRMFGIRTWHLDDATPDFLRQTEEVVDWVRSEGKPAMLVIETARLGPHSKGDELRPHAELERIQARDPLEQYARQLHPNQRRVLEEENSAFIENIVQTVLNMAPATPDTLRRMRSTAQGNNTSTSHHSNQAWIPLRKPVMPLPDITGSITVRNRLQQTMAYVLEHYPESILLGEDLHAPYGGAFKVTGNLSERFPGRVLSTPISEAGITGMALGMATEGMKPILEIMFADFLTLCVDQIANHAVKLNAILPGSVQSFVIRTPSGGRRGYGPTHSQSLENLFVSIPGLTIIYPSYRHDPGMQLLSSLVDNGGCVLFFEHKLLYGLICNPGEYVSLPDREGIPWYPTLVRRREQPDITLITFGGMLPVVEDAALVLETEEELQVEIIVASRISPFPKAIIDAVKGRKKVVVAEESCMPFGIGAEVLALLLESGFHGKAARIGARPEPIPAAPGLEKAVLPQVNDVIHTVFKLFQ